MGVVSVLSRERSLLKHVTNTCMQAHSDSIDAAQNGQRHRFGLRIAYPEAATEISAEGVLIGSGAEATLRLDSPMVGTLFMPSCCFLMEFLTRRLAKQLGRCARATPRQHHCLSSQLC